MRKSLRALSLTAAAGTALVGLVVGCQPAGSWGQAIFIENFSGATINTSHFGAYDYPSGSPRRSAALVTQANGELRIAGSSDSKGEIGSGVFQRIGGDQEYGRWEVRFRVDAAVGFPYAILLYPGPGVKYNEIDLVESPSATRQTAQNTVHKGSYKVFSEHPLKADFTKWNTVAVDWFPDHLTFWLNGKVSWTVTDPKYIPTGSTMHLAMQLDTCSAWPGTPCRDPRKTYPQAVLHIDSVRLYKWHAA